jgi:hypothetical protein
MNQSFPYKSTAVALMFSVFLGPVGLLYSSFWGGFALIMLAIVFLSCKFYFLTTLVWLACCIWGVGAVESYNRKLFQASHKV